MSSINGVFGKALCSKSFLHQYRLLELSLLQIISRHQIGLQISQSNRANAHFPIILLTAILQKNLLIHQDHTSYQTRKGRNYNALQPQVSRSMASITATSYTSIRSCQSSSRKTTLVATGSQNSPQDSCYDIQCRKQKVFRTFSTFIILQMCCGQSKISIYTVSQKKKAHRFHMTVVSTNGD